MRLIGLLIVSVFCVSAYAKEGRPFGWLSEKIVEYMPVGEIRILYNPRIANPIERKREDEGFVYKIILETKLNVGDSEVYEVEFFEGLSVDPSFSIYRNKNGERKALIEVGGTELVVPGNGYVYVSGHTNSIFNVRRKFQYVDGEFIEIEQPYKYVGLSTKTNADIDIFTTKNQKNKVAHLPSGTKIEVLINDGDFFLIRTGFGLVGWYLLKEVVPIGLENDSPIDGLYFAGD